MVFRFHFLKLILLFNDLSFESTNNGVGCNKYLCKAKEIYERQYVFGRKLKLCSTKKLGYYRSLDTRLIYMLKLFRYTINVYSK